MYSYHIVAETRQCQIALTIQWLTKFIFFFWPCFTKTGNLDSEARASCLAWRFTVQHCDESEGYGWVIHIWSYCQHYGIELPRETADDEHLDSEFDRVPEVAQKLMSLHSDELVAMANPPPGVPLKAS